MRNHPPNTWSVAVVAALIGSLIGLAVPAIAARVGDPMELGVSNTVSRQTALIRNRAGVALAVTAKGGGSPLKLVSKDGSPPMKINSSAKVIRLNADKLDGLDSTAFLGAASKAADADKLDGMDSTAFLGATAKATDADRVDGKDSTAFLGVGDKAADSGLLDGMDSTAFLGAWDKAADSHLLDGLDWTAFLGVSDQAADSDAVDGYSADGLVRVAFDASFNLPDGDAVPFTSGTVGAGDVLSASITAPTAGWLVITGAVDAFNDTIFNSYDCRLRVDGSFVKGTTMESRLDGAGFTNEEEDCTTHGVAEVAAGAHTVTYRLEYVATTTDFGGGSLSAMFVPFDGTGAISTCTTTPCP